MEILSRLPDDLVPIVLRQWAATVLQCHLSRWHRFRHVRRRLWSRLRASMPRSVHSLLLRHAAIRREWYYEPASWLSHDESDLKTILIEVEQGYWGSPAAP